MSAVFFALLLLFDSAVSENERPELKTNPLKTQWTAKVKPDNVHSEYPRPCLVRKQWYSLNGLWNFEQGRGDEKILVPFPAGSLLSGVKTTPDRCTYRRTFTIPANWEPDHRILLHFGAADWETTVFVNGVSVGTHQGGYDAFSFDITDHSHRDTENELVVQIIDPTNYGQQPRGKQSVTPSGTLYSATTGIWQTVWLEPVAPDYIQALKIDADYDTATVVIQANLVLSKELKKKNLTVLAEVFEGEKSVAQCFGGLNGKLLVRLDRNEMKAWSPDSPNLYQLRVKILDKDKTIDQVGSYFAFRKIEKIKGKDGVTRVWLNGKPLFLMGVIDQGYWSDGFYTAPTDGAVRMDIGFAKSMGFNLIRKYQKIEPERWYFWCDRLGILVWQDMPSGENRDASTQSQFSTELKRMVNNLANHPSIILWTIFNEGAGQHNAAEYTQLVKKLDPSRLVCSASGWTDTKIGDVNVSHKFPGPEVPVTADEHRVTLIGEYGGLTLAPPAPNCWTPNTWGYLHVANSEVFLKKYQEAQQTIRKQIQSNGLAGAVFHQLYDIESECNGLTSYDRNILKISDDSVEKLNKETIRYGSKSEK